MSEHIKIELDFIPVEEREPIVSEDTGILVPVLRGNKHKEATLTFDLVWFHDEGDDGTSWESREINRKLYDVVYWALAVGEMAGRLAGSETIR